MIEAVLFDVDGVLLSTGSFGSQLMQESGLTRAEVDAFWRGPFVQCTLGNSDLREEFQSFLGGSNYPGTVDDCLQSWFTSDSSWDEDALEVVKALGARGMPCHVASNQESHRATFLEDTLRASNSFVSFFFSCRLNARKPNLEFYEQVTRILCVHPSAILFVDDQSANVEAARKAGWNAELYESGDNLREILVRYGTLPAD